MCTPKEMRGTKSQGIVFMAHPIAHRYGKLLYHSWDRMAWLAVGIATAEMMPANTC